MEQLAEAAGITVRTLRFYRERKLIPPPRRDELDTRAELFRPRVVAWFWPFAREEPDGHPPFYALVGLLGDVLAPGWELLPRARLGPMLLFSAVGGALFGFLARRLGPWPAAVALGAWLSHPDLFALAHYATYDGILTSLWVGATLAFAAAITQGNLEALARLLARDAVFIADGGGKVNAVPRPLHGAERIAKALYGFFKLTDLSQMRVRQADINGLSGVVMCDLDGAPVQTMALDYDEAGLIQGIYVMRNPDKMRHLRARA